LIPVECDIWRTGRVISCRVFGRPRAQGSKRHVGGGRMVETPELVDWRKLVSHVAGKAARDAGWSPLAGPCGLVLTCYRQAPKSPKWKAGGLPDTIPDADKLARAVCDSLSGVWYDDDRRIVNLTVMKRFGPIGCEVALTELIETANPANRRTHV